MTSLSDFTGVDKKTLRQKFGLEPLYQFDRNERENPIFMSHSILLNDTELKHGGDLEMSPKKVLGLVTKDILKSKDPTLFQVPEVTCLHMGYGKNSKNKEGRMAISGNDAKAWLDVLNLPFAELERDDQVEATAETDDSLFDETVQPCNSGLKIPQMGSQILLMSILVINSRRKSPKMKSNSPRIEDNKKWRIGANKISDFLVFWTLPYLLNFTQRKVQEIVVHHTARGNDPQSLVKTVKKSAWDIISQATESKPEHQSKLKEKLWLYFSDALQQEYTLLQCDGSPVVLVPLSCVYAEKDNPLHLEDIGRKWVSSMSTESFLSAFVKSKEIQLDYFKCMETAKLRTGVDYAILFPDVGAFELFFSKVRAVSSVLNDLKKVDRQGKESQSPFAYHAVVKCSGQNVIVCFSYFQGTDPGSVSALFRAVGAHFFNQFTIVFLHGSNFKKHDVHCKLGNLYHVREAKCMVFRRGKLQKLDDKETLFFRNGISKFVKFKFPKSFKLFEKNVLGDDDVKKAMAELTINPGGFEPSQHLKVAFARNSQKGCLKKACLHKNEKIKNSNLKELLDQDIKAANLDGCLFSNIYQHGRKGNIGVTLAISNTLGPEDPPPVLKTAMNMVMFHFVMAILNAGLRSGKVRMLRWFPPNIRAIQAKKKLPKRSHNMIKVILEHCTASILTSLHFLSHGLHVIASLVFPSAPDEKEPVSTARADAPIKGDTAERIQKKSLKKDASSSRAQKRCRDAAEGTQDGSSSTAQKRCKVDSSTNEAGSDGVYDDNDDDYDVGNNEGSSDSNEEGEEEEQKPSSSQASASDTYPPEEASQSGSSGSEAGSDSDDDDGDDHDDDDDYDDDYEEEDDEGNVDSSKEGEEEEQKPSSSQASASVTCLPEESSQSRSFGSEAGSDSDDDDGEVEDDEGSDDSSVEAEEEEQKPSSSRASASVTCLPEKASQIKAGRPRDEELERLANVVERWKPLGRRLKIKDAKLKAFEKENPELSEQVYQMLLYWKQQNGNDATYQILFNALKNDLVSHRDLGEKFCCE